ncbi:MAG: hypothetical protein Q8N99_08680 [Nanoarchaeota archaeon]|nr:hypothetical protein [Nanoarchaeota archaeon]
MNNKAISKFSKIMIIAQALLVFSVLGILYFYVPRVSGSINGETSDLKVINGNAILIDDNPEFESPMKIDTDKFNMSDIEFSPGIYYVKPVGLIEGTVKKYEIKSKAGLEIDLNKSVIKNVGNVALNISFEGDNGTEGLTILDVKVEYGINESEVNIYKGEMK